MLLQAFRCKQCCVDFPTSWALTTHVKSHHFCSDCGFEGLKKLVEKHAESFHPEGMCIYIDMFTVKISL
jgi:hypothetical protein